MSIFEKLDRSQGGYIFVSHSHKDIEKVRGIRNELEQNGFEPLCFYLKCLDDDSEIEGLIQREIDAREWFVFVNSDNARKSKWVTKERNYINRTNRKKIITIDLDQAVSITDAVEKILRNLRVFLSYSSKNQPVADRIYSKLKEKDYLVFYDKESAPDMSSYINTAADAIVRASKEGCVLALISPDYMKSPWAKKELCLALREKGNVIPVILGNFEMTEEMKLLIGRYQWYRLPENPSDDEIEAMIDEIGRRIVLKEAE